MKIPILLLAFIFTLFNKNKDYLPYLSIDTHDETIKSLTIYKTSVVSRKKKICYSIQNPGNYILCKISIIVSLLQQSLTTVLGIIWFLL